ncbi:hypothetical protein R6Z07M_015459 [Ovis aries]
MSAAEKKEVTGRAAGFHVLLLFNSERLLRDQFYQEFEQHAAGAPRPSPALPPDPDDLGAAGPQARNTKEVGAPRAGLHRPPAGLLLGTSRPLARPRHGILKEGRALRKTTHLLLRKTPFCHLAREIWVQFTRGVDFRWQARALLALQEAAERFDCLFFRTFLVRLFQDAYLLALHARRVALPEGCAAGPRIRGIQKGLG